MAKATKKEQTKQEEIFEQSQGQAPVTENQNPDEKKDDKKTKEQEAIKIEETISPDEHLQRARDEYKHIFGVEPKDEWNVEDINIILDNVEYTESLRLEMAQKEAEEKAEKERLNKELLESEKEAKLIANTYLVRNKSGDKTPYRIPKGMYDKMDGDKPEIVVDEPDVVKQLKEKQNGINKNSK